MISLNDDDRGGFRFLENGVYYFFDLIISKYNLLNITVDIFTPTASKQIAIANVVSSLRFYWITLLIKDKRWMRYDKMCKYEFWPG